ncbi:sugar transferase [Bacillus sp. FJAT-28004]|uniref:sugar transferase n=1 Tax=Bacillus sp. FJAT-28004 TaxID=1679165 RepID=UPI0006B5F825|nr:sugar transferase [Bacillus sp. FJAT-28004]
MRTSKSNIYSRLVKRPMDFTISLFSFIILIPILILLACIARIKLGGPILFKQQRPGLNEKIFTVYKFRTMTDERDENGKLLPDSVRLTKFGSFLRSTSFDELPQLFNIIKGDMSFIGPRPLLVEYLPMYNEHQRRRHEVRPGLTGLAQISGRNNISWEETFDLDIQYIETMGFLKECEIILATIKTVLLREGINSEARVTMELTKRPDNSVGM